MEATVPEKLYHYTNLESLALILRNQTIRFMPLSSMDDPQENISKDIANLGRFFFASCWTDDEEESIPMWKMYASLESGVRISLPKYPFKRHPATRESLASASGFPIENVSVEGERSTTIPAEDLARGIFTPFVVSHEGMLRKIEYTSDINRLEPEIASVVDNIMTLSFADFGQVKNEKWQFQHEWRYLAPIFPFNLFEDPSTFLLRFSKMAQDLIDGTLIPPCLHYDFYLDENALKEIEITPSPRMHTGNRALLEMLLERYNLSSSIRESELEGLL